MRSWDFEAYVQVEINLAQPDSVALAQPDMVALRVSPEARLDCALRRLSGHVSEDLKHKPLSVWMGSAVAGLGSCAALHQHPGELWNTACVKTINLNTKAPLH